MSRFRVLTPFFRGGDVHLDARVLEVFGDGAAWPCDCHVAGLDRQLDRQGGEPDHRGQGGGPADDDEIK